MFSLFQVWPCMHNYKIFYSHRESYKIMLYDNVIYVLSVTSSKTDFNTNHENNPQTHRRTSWILAAVS